MCEFASSVITRDKEFFLPKNDSHSNIIRHFGLNEHSAVTGAHIVKIEITPNEDIKTWPSLAEWNYRIDQDILPDWHNADPYYTKVRAFAALERRAKGGFVKVKLANMNNLKSLALTKKTKTLVINTAKRLETVSAPGATDVDLYELPKLSLLSVPKVIDLEINFCHKLTKVVASRATDHVGMDNNRSLQYVSLKRAKVVSVNWCTKLTKVYAPSATEVYITGTPRGIVVKAKKGATIWRGTTKTIVK